MRNLSHHVRVSLKVDSVASRRNYTSLRELVLSIRDATDPSAEHHAIEWKTSTDIALKSGQFAVARAIIGLANRTVEGAKRHFEGLGYVIVGVEPGNLIGTAQWDGQHLEPLLASYLGTDGPVWHHDNIEVDGMNVVVFTVEAPDPGDHIHTLRKSWTSDDGKRSAEEGTIFVRRNAATHRANTAEIRSLERRAQVGGQPTLSLNLSGLESSPLRAIRIDLSDRSLGLMVEHERAEVSGSLAPKAERGLFPGIDRSGEKARIDDQVERYLSSWRKVALDMFRDLVFSQTKKHHSVITVTNPGDEALEGVRVKLSFGAEFEAYFEEISPDVPARPDNRYLPAGMASLVRQSMNFGRLQIARPDDPEVVKNGAGIDLVFRVGTIHAKDTIELEPFLLLYAGQSVPPAVAKATATSTNRSGTVETELECRSSAGTIVPSDLGLSAN